MISVRKVTLEQAQPTLSTQWMRTAAGLEVLTGLTLVLMPSILSFLLFGSGLNAAGEATGRICGLVMLCLALGCLPRAGGSGRRQVLIPLIALSWLATGFLAVTGFIGANVGLLLWPATMLHLSLALLLARLWAKFPAGS